MASYLHSSALESYHNVILKYVPKRLHFPYDHHKMRLMLAVIDHNLNAGRDVIHEYMTWRKATKRWGLVKRKGQKENTWRLCILAMAIERKKKGLASNIQHRSDLPQNLSIEPRPHS